MTTTTTPAEQNATAALARIFGLYDLDRVAQSVPMELSALSFEAREVLSDNDWNPAEMAEPYELHDHVSQAAYELPLSIEYRARWTAGTTPTDPDSFEIWLCVGGPSCWIDGDFGQHGVPSADSISVQYSWGPSDCGRLSLSDHEREALSWFVEMVAV